MKVFIGAGEPSGDRIAAAILAALKNRHGEMTLCGFGGPLCAAQGLSSSYPLDALAVNGLGDVLKRGVFLARARAALLRELAAARPDVVLLVDYPGMNVTLARRARRLGTPVHYVAPPQLWAYKNPVRRLGRLRRALDGASLQVLFPFEAASWPDWRPPLAQGHFFSFPAFETAWERGGARLLLCPGSRRGVMHRNLPLWLARVHAFFGTLEGVDILVPENLAAEARGLLARALLPARETEATTRDAETPGARVLTDKREAFARAGAAIAMPGTVTLELFLERIPTRIWAILDPLTLWAGRRALRGPRLALPSAIAGAPLMPEWVGTRRDFHRDPPAIPATRDAWNPEATTEAVHTVWRRMGSGEGVAVATAAVERHLSRMGVRVRPAGVGPF